MENNAQLNGWFGRLLKKLITAVATYVDGATLGVFNFKGLAADIGDGGFWNGNNYWQRIATGEPTAAEETILLNWNDTRFAPFCAALGQRILDMQNSTTADAQIEILNEINSKMCAVRSYFLTNELTGLLQNGRDTRTDLIDESFLMLLAIMQPVVDALQAIETQVTVSSFGNDYGNLIPHYYNILPTVCDRYSLTNSDVEPVNVTEIIQQNAPVVTVIPTVPNQTTQPTNNTPSAHDDKPSPLKKILVFAGVTALLVWAYSDDDKN